MFLINDDEQVDRIISRKKAIHIPVKEKGQSKKSIKITTQDHFCLSKIIYNNIF